MSQARLAQERILTGEVIGYRQWLVHKRGSLSRSLSPVSRGKPWQKGMNTAVCDRSLFGGQHARSLQECECGLHAQHEPLGAADVLGVVVWDQDAVSVVGAIAAWGEVAVHYGGFRAEHARIVALALERWDPSSQPSWEDDQRAFLTYADFHRDRNALIAWTASQYKVPVVDPGDLEAVANEHGSSVPMELRPEAPLEPELGIGKMGQGKSLWRS